MNKSNLNNIYCINSKFRIFYSEFHVTSKIKNYFIYLSYLSKINILLDKKLISQMEYEKIREKIDLIAQL